MRLALALAAGLACGLAAPSAVRAEVVEATVRGWTARCDAPTCRASLPSASGKQALMIGRFEAGDGVALGLSTPGAIADRDRPMTLRIDGRRVADLEPGRGFAPRERVEALWIVDARLAETVVAALDGAKQLRFEYIDVTGAPYDADFDVSAFRDLLAWTDARLGRATRRAKGVVPVGLAEAPAPSRADLVVRQGVPPRLIAKHVAASDCEAPNSPLLRTFKPVIGVLSSTAILYAVPCTASSGNVSFRAWVVESGEIGGITPLYFAMADPVLGWRGTDLVHNVEYDDKTQRLTSTQRTGAGCGVRGVWRWKKWAFAMEEMRVAEDCVEGRSPADWPRVWPLDKAAPLRPASLPAAPVAVMPAPAQMPVPPTAPPAPESPAEAPPAAAAPVPVPAPVPASPPPADAPAATAPPT
ncbi:DUF1176 domain-containing protein [Siculibacillus lacustris]|uniref:DUF1176 domain-containing protein n=1 Tax=Siculibacillus lacustris TaxID=1549641 RepID=A0A4Q9VHR9_9HYPH|nr:DUF1176 domain-containing protein [Siculibacillus lacustris]TBW34717.1 DUF1176 domain-containing protein [Siculibacillus lacustris]